MALWLAELVKKALDNSREPCKIHDMVWIESFMAIYARKE